MQAHIDKRKLASCDSVLKQRQFDCVAEFINSEVGIQLPQSKFKLVEGRLRKRLIDLGFTDFKNYLEHTLKSPEGEHEKLNLIDVITTNKTNFFRESDHFDYLENVAIHELQQLKNKQSRPTFHFWSAGCSTGEEPYTLSIVLNELVNKHNNFQFDILATDISNSCLQKASRGIYTERQIEIIPMELRKKYLLRSRNPTEKLVQMGDDLRSRIKFQSLNLMSSHFNVAHTMDAIFCRNVMIYFNDETREALVSKFESKLIQGGYLFVGHSESLNGIETSLKQVAPMVYRKL